MIISHKYRFIFIKTEKTGGTSLEISLSGVCGSDDVITPFGKEHNINSDDENLRHKLGFRGAQNFRVPWKDLSARGILRTIYRRRRPPLYTEHEFARDIRRKLGEKTFNKYLKFSIMRNPFDRAVSSYFWHRHIGASANSLFDFIVSNPSAINRNWTICSDENRKLVLDMILRYEHLEKDLAIISERIGLAGNIYDEMSCIRAKGSIRPDRARDYRNLIDARSRKLIELLCADEIETFGYGF